MPSDPAASSPDASSLYQAALNHLARYAATEAGLRTVLLRRVDRWARLQTDAEAAAPVIAAAHAAIENTIVRLVQAGAINDAAFAESRAKRLARGGQSSRAVAARLIAKGVAPDVARAASSSDTATELAAALVLTRKRRIGPYRAATDVDSAVRMREMGLLARAGFSRDVARQALDMPRDEAESRIFDLRL
jgi:regulatory protein